MSNIKSYFEMRPWEPEAIQTKEENDLLIKGVLHEIKGATPGADCILVGGDTLVYGVVDSDGDYCLYECTIRRTSANLVVEGQVMRNNIAGGIN